MAFVFCYKTFLPFGIVVLCWFPFVILRFKDANEGADRAAIEKAWLDSAERSKIVSNLSVAECKRRRYI